MQKAEASANPTQVATQNTGIATPKVSVQTSAHTLNHSLSGTLHTAPRKIPSRLGATRLYIEACGRNPRGAQHMCSRPAHALLESLVFIRYPNVITWCGHGSTCTKMASVRTQQGAHTQRGRHDAAPALRECPAAHDTHRGLCRGYYLGRAGYWGRATRGLRPRPKGAAPCERRAPATGEYRLCAASCASAARGQGAAAQGRAPRFLERAHAAATPCCPPAQPRLQLTQFCAFIAAPNVFPSPALIWQQPTLRRAARPAAARLLTTGRADTA